MALSCTAYGDGLELMQFKSLIVMISLAICLPSVQAHAEAVQRKGFLSFLAPTAAAKERRAKRQSQDASAAATAPVAVSSDARAEIKAAVEAAKANRPKGHLWCVPFARSVSGVNIRGNAKTWWSKAKGVYERGHMPKVGAVMAFSASRSMPQGHVGVVSKVISDREVLLDQANWERNRVTQDQLAVDISPKNDWSMVRVANRAGSLGRANPVSGFIYN